MMGIESFVSSSYRREDFYEFLRGFLPGFVPEETPVKPLIGTIFEEGGISRIGEDKKLSLAVYEFWHDRKDPRVTLARDAFEILGHYEKRYHQRALAVFVNRDKEEYRFSLMTREVGRDPKTKKIKSTWSNPRRFSFVLGGGEGITRNTPRTRLSGKVKDIDDLKKRFSVEALTDDFYNRIKEWFLWAREEVKFPGSDQFVDTTDKEHQSMMTLRLITRLIFIWFLKQKVPVPDALFEKDKIYPLLNLEKFSSHSPYYRAILQNLFFATLNTQRKARKWSDDKTSQDWTQEYFRYKDFFKGDKERETFYGLCDQIPFVNGGLFENLDGIMADDDFRKDDAKRVDCFSDEDLEPGKPERLKVPDDLFFGSKGIIEILRQYNFTIEENVPNDEDVALDPELLGCVFEGLLDYVSSGKPKKEKPEKEPPKRSKDREKKKSGSYYTPRVIVDYMIDQALKAYLETKVNNHECLEALFASDTDTGAAKYKDNTEFKDAVAKALDEVKILDPACGSGAFPMGMLSKMIQILEKVGAIDIKKPHEIYKKKLNIVRECIYGADLQNIAVQISKLRFFISLLCEQEVDTNDENFGIKQLPNLETKIVCADSLFRLGISESLLGPKIEEIKSDLINWRNEHVDKHSIEDKINLRKNDKDSRKCLAALLLGGSGDFASPNDVALLTNWDPYSQNSVSQFFEPDWMFGISKFDIIIGNPPYINLGKQKHKSGKKLGDYYHASREYRGQRKYRDIWKYKTEGDMYCLFYERSLQILKDGGHICFITSNKWMRSEYGESLRGLLAKENPKLLIDFPGVKIFPDATVDPNILLVQKSANKKNTVGVTVKDEDSVRVLSSFVKQEKNYEKCDFSNSEIWVILSEIEKEIKKDIEKAGTPLGEWRDIEINSGIKTACDPVFTIDDETCMAILEKCKGEEYTRTCKLIRPLVKGEDVKKGSKGQIGNWLINTHNGVKDSDHPIPPIDVKRDYPTVRAYLDQHWEKISSRQDQGITPYNLRDCAYLNNFDKPKIIYQELSGGGSFFLDRKGEYFALNSAYIIVTKDEVPKPESIELLETLMQFFNSKVVRFAFGKFYATTIGGGGIRWLLKDVVKLPIPRGVKGTGLKDEDFYKMYGLDRNKDGNPTQEKRKHIESFT